MSCVQSRPRVRQEPRYFAEILMLYFVFFFAPVAEAIHNGSSGKRRVFYPVPSFSPLTMRSSID